MLEYQYKIGARRMLFWSVALIIGGIVYGIMGLVNQDPRGYLGLGFFALAIYSAAYPYIFTKKSEKRLHQRYGGVIPVTRIQFGETIEVSEADIEFSLDYSDLQRVVVLKNGIFMSTKGRRGIMLDPDGFIKGNKDEFMPFLRKQCPNATFLTK